MQCAKENREKATKMSSVGGNWDWNWVERWKATTEGWFCRKWEYVVRLGGHFVYCLRVCRTLQSVAVSPVLKQSYSLISHSGLVFTPDYMGWCNGAVACQGKESSSVWLTDSRFTWAAKPAVKKPPEGYRTHWIPWVTEYKVPQVQAALSREFRWERTTKHSTYARSAGNAKKEARAGWDAKFSNLRQWSRAAWWVFWPRPSVRAKD